MFTVDTIQVYVLATAITTTVWIAYVLWFTYPPDARVRAEEVSPLIRRIVQALWWVSVADFTAAMIVTTVALFRNYFGLPNLLDTAPLWLPVVLYVQYALVYAVAASPATVLYVLVTALDDLEERIKK